MQIQPYLFFNGRCEEALAFYAKALGAEVTVKMLFRENPDPPPPGQLPPGLDDKVMHASMRIQQAEVMCSDGMSTDGPDFRGVSLSLAVDNAADADRLFNALAEGGTVQMPMGKSFFAQRFGMVEDRFGLGWMVTVPQAR